MPSPLLLEAPDLPTAWKTLVPTYESAQYRPLLVKIASWESEYPQAIAKISARRVENRWNNYVAPAELERVKQLLLGRLDCAFRFGVKKPGRGYHGGRGDFCLVGAAIDGRALTVMYRSLELIGGLAYDLVLIDQLYRELDIKPWKSVTIFAARANVFAVKKNSNEKLYPKLWSIFSGKNL